MELGLWGSTGDIIHRPEPVGTDKSGGRQMKIFILFGPEEQGLKGVVPLMSIQLKLPNQVRQPQVGPRRTGVERGLNHLRFLPPPKGSHDQPGRPCEAELEPVWRLGPPSRAWGSCWSVDSRVPPAPLPAMCSVYTSALACYSMVGTVYWGVSLRTVLLPPRRLSHRATLPVQPRVTAGVDRGDALRKSCEESDTPVMKSPWAMRTTVVSGAKAWSELAKLVDRADLGHSK